MAKASPILPEVVPQRFPFRLVETVSSGEPGRVGVVLVSANGFLAPARPWPTTLVAEALAQSILTVVAPPDTRTLRLVGMNGVTVMRSLAAGDRLEVEVREVGVFGTLRRYACRAIAGGCLAAVAEFTVSS